MLGEGEAEDSSIFLRIMLLALPLPLSLPQWRGISLLAVDPATEAVEASGKRRKKTRRGSRGSGNALWGSMGCCAVVLGWDGQLLPTKSMPCHAAQLLQSTLGASRNGKHHKTI